MGFWLYNLAVRSYSLFINLAAPFNPKAGRWVEGRRGLREQINGIINSLPPTHVKARVWMHCASLGEFEQGRPLLEALRQKHPDLVILLSFFSPSGYQSVGQYPGADAVFYLPPDSSQNARWLIEMIQPRLVLWVKYEFWFHYVNSLRARNIPLLLVAGLFRPGQPFFSWYGGLWRKMLHCFRFLFVQNEESAILLSGLGILNASVSGDTRFDRVLQIAESNEPVPGVAEFCGNARVLVAGSTWPKDEELLFGYFSGKQNLALIIAPHETDQSRVGKLTSLFPGAIRYSEWSANAFPPLQTGPSRVLIIDSIGLLSRLYRYAHITYVGGGFNRGGIHNILEPAVYGKPVLFGPVYQKFSEAVEMAARGSGIPIHDEATFKKSLERLWENPSLLKEKSEDAGAYVKEHGGATQAIIDYIAANRLLTN